jgi:hypothetical protein
VNRPINWINRSTINRLGRGWEAGEAMEESLGTGRTNSSCSSASCRSDLALVGQTVWLLQVGTGEARESRGRGLETGESTGNSSRRRLPAVAGVGEEMANPSRRPKSRGGRRSARGGRRYASRRGWVGSRAKYCLSFPPQVTCSVPTNRSDSPVNRSDSRLIGLAS